VTACEAPEGQGRWGKNHKSTTREILPLLPRAGALLADPDRRETYLPKLLRPQRETEWEGTDTWRSHTKLLSSFALRIGAEILLSRRDKRLKGKPDPPIFSIITKKFNKG
jgi:hypothetical protein